MTPTILHRDLLTAMRRHLSRAHKPVETQADYDGFIRKACDATTQRVGFEHATAVRVATWDVAAAVQRALRQMRSDPERHWLKVLAAAEQALGCGV